MKISFVIPAYNEAAVLPATLTALREAGAELGLDYEIVVADDWSDDGTGDIARGHGAVVVRGENRQISKTRNMGANVATGDVFVFVDADTVVPVGVVRAMMAALEGGAVGGGAGVEYSGPLPLWARVVFMPVTFFYLRILRMAPGCYLYCTRGTFEACGGFDERIFVAEETFMSRKIRKQGRFVIVRERVLTDGRKLRTHSGWDILKVSVGVALRGPKALRSRDRFDLWYGERRDDPSP